MHTPLVTGREPSRARLSSVERPRFSNNERPRLPSVDRPNQPPYPPAWPADSLALLALANPSGSEDSSPTPSTAHLRAALFDAITADLRAGTTTPWDQLRSAILQNRTAQLQQCATDAEDDDSPTILHWLARKLKFEAVPEDDARFAVAQFLAEVAAEVEPGMLVVKDRGSGSTPVHLFLGVGGGVARQGVARVVLGVCRTAVRCGGGGKGGKELVARALACRDGGGRNCLHLAVSRELPDFGELVAMADADAVVERRDGEGNTPLHDVVDAGLCDLGVRKCRTGSSGAMCSDCEAATLRAERKRAWVVQAVTALIVRNPGVLTVKNKAGLPPLLYHKARVRAGTTGISSSRSSPSANGGSLRHQREGSGALRPAGVDKGECQSVPTNSLAMDIEKYLVESAFGLNSFDRVCECFFGDNTDPDSQEQETVFRPERPLDIFSDSDSYPFLNFGETLAQVDLSIDPNDSSELAEIAAREPSLVQNYQTALVGVFRMLAEKGVKRILRLSVRDNPKEPCSDELIQRCLRDFEIRYLNWNKPDLRADIVVASAPRLVGIWLCSSGNNAVLREWVGSGGLCNLHQLRMVDVRSQPGVEWTPRLLQDLDAFEKDLVASIKLYRYLKIASMEAVRVQDETMQLRAMCDSFNEFLNIPEAHRKKSILAVYGPDTKPSRRQAEFLRQVQIPRLFGTYRTRFEELRRASEKLMAFKQKLLQTKGDNVLPSNPGNTTTATGRSGGRLGGTPIDFSGLEGSGIEVSPFLAFRVDFVALAFNVDTASIQPPVKSGRIKYDGPIEDREAQSAKHRWLHSLRTFVSEHVRRSDRGARVRVAIIDDGVDGFHEDLRGKIKAGWPREKATSPWEPFYRSDHGHGTAMARLVAAACPHVDLYVAKLKTLSKHISPEQADSLLDEDHFDGSISSSSGWMSTAHEAAQAVDWARRKGVHVVCMSWSMQAAADNAAQTRLLSQRMQEAARNGIIMYCSASDQGLYGALKTLYPAAADTAGVRVVGAATERGRCSDAVNEELVSYLFPGEGIDEIGSEKKGSSAATALAAGFAALVLWCFAVARPRSRAGMGSPQAMHYLFEGLQSLLAAKAQECRRTKWVDASMLLEQGGIEEVVDFVEGEVRRRDPLILPKGEIRAGQRLPECVNWGDE